MVEKNRIIQKQFAYEGLFRYRELFRLLDFWLRDKFFDKKEKGTGEYRNPDGSKQIHILFEPWKKVTDYYKVSLRIELMVKNMKEVEVEIDGKKERLNHGFIECVLSGFLVLDYDNRMEKRAGLQFLRDMFQRYVYHHITKKYTEMVVDDLTDLENTLRSYLNTFTKKREGSFESGREHTRYS